MKIRVFYLFFILLVASKSVAADLTAWTPKNAPLQFQLSVTTDNTVFNLRIKNNTDFDIKLQPYALKGPVLTVFWTQKWPSGEQGLARMAGQVFPDLLSVPDSVKENKLTHLKPNQIIELSYDMKKSFSTLKNAEKFRIVKFNKPQMVVLVKFINLVASSDEEAKPEETTSLYAPTIRIRDLSKLWPDLFPISK